MAGIYCTGDAVFRAKGSRAGMHSVFSKLPLAKGAKDSIRTPILCPSASPSLPGQSSREGLSRAHSDGFQSKGNHASGYHPHTDQGQHKTHMDKLPFLRLKYPSRQQSLDNMVP